LEPVTHAVPSTISVGGTSDVTGHFGDHLFAVIRGVVTVGTSFSINARVIQIMPTNAYERDII
jgi:hypothetical protein